MEIQLEGKVNVQSLVQGYHNWKVGTLSLRREVNMWKLMVQFQVHQTARFKWRLRGRLKTAMYTNKEVRIRMSDDSQVRINAITSGDPEIFVNKLKCLSQKIAPEAEPGPSHAPEPQRIPLSPKQDNSEGYWNMENEDRLIDMYLEHRHLLEKGVPGFKLRIEWDIAVAEYSKALDIPFDFVSTRLKSLRGDWNRSTAQDPSGSGTKVLTQGQVPGVRRLSSLTGHVVPGNQTVSTQSYGDNIPQGDDPQKQTKKAQSASSQTKSTVTKKQTSPRKEVLYKIPSCGRKQRNFLITVSLFKKDESTEKGKPTFLQRGTAKAQASVQSFNDEPPSCINFYKRSRNPSSASPPTVKRMRKAVHALPPLRSETPNNAGLKGLPNLGNTCYMNACLQSLLHLPTFCTELISLFRKGLKIQGRESQRSLYSVLGRMMSLMRNKNGLVSNWERDNALHAVREVVFKIAPRFNSGKEEDSHEFMVTLLSSLQDEVEAFDKDSSRGDTQPANPVLDNFAFEVCHTIQCLDCGAKVNKCEPFIDLALDMPPESTCEEQTLQEALNLYYQGEGIEHKCEKCGSFRAHITHKFTRLPRILLLHLKRWRIDKHAKVTKNVGSVGIPPFLTLQDHCDEGTSSFKLPESSSASPINEGETGFTDMKENVHTPAIPRRKLDFNRLQDDSSASTDSPMPGITRLGTPGKKDVKKFYGPHDGSRDVETSPVREQPTEEGNKSDTKNIQTDIEGSSPAKPEQSEDDKMPESQKDDLQQYYGAGMDEDGGLQAALALSLKESGLSEEEENDIKRATELSLRDMEVDLSPDKEGDTDQETKTGPKQLTAKQKHAQSGDLPNSYRLVNVISHIGENQSLGHYVCDTIDFKRNQWYGYSDELVSNTTEAHVYERRQRTGYIFTYVAREVYDMML